MTEPAASAVLDAVSPGALLRAAREARDMDEREAAERLHWVPEYVAVIERDDFAALRSPAFARGYVKAYGRLLEVNEELLLQAFDSVNGAGDSAAAGRRVSSRPQDMQRTGLGVVIGLTTLFLLVLALWWLRGGQVSPAAPRPSALEQPLPGSGQEIVDGAPASPASVGR